MSEKRDLAALCGLLDRPIAEFIASESFKKLEQEADVVRVVEPFGLPEVKRLICCSPILVQQQWAEKYYEARKLYDNEITFDVFALLMQYHDVLQYEKKILSCVDGMILDKINTFFNTAIAEKEQAKKERASLKGKITKAKKKLEKERSKKAVTVGIVHTEPSKEAVVSEMRLSKSVSEQELCVAELSKRIDEKEQMLKMFKEHISLTESYRNALKNEEEIDSKRQKAYRVLGEIKPPVEEEFLNRYIQTGDLSTEDEKSLKNPVFLQCVIQLLDNTSYRDVAFPVLAKLYSDNAIDLECDFIATFVNEHSRMLAMYLESQYSAIPNYLDDIENRVFLEYSIKGTIAGNDDYATWWNAISEASDWKIILDVVNEIASDSVLKSSVKLLRYVSGDSMNAFMELIRSEQAEVFEITPTEFMIELIGQVAPQQQALVGDYIRTSDKTLCRLQRRIAVKQREINGYSQELFSALYQPIEQLETLAVNLKRSDGDIKCSLVASHVINALVNLREGLSALGLDTADEVEAWSGQLSVDYKPEKHRNISASDLVGKQVKLQTLGFSYTDDEGNDRLRVAEVYCPARVETQTQKIPEQRKQKQLSDDTPSKRKNGYPKNKAVPKNLKESTHNRKGKKK